MNERAGRSDISTAMMMLHAFAGAGATAFDLTMTDIAETPKYFQAKCSLSDLRRDLAKRLDAAARLQYSVIVRPRSKTALLVQLDDFTGEKAE